MAIFLLLLVVVVARSRCQHVKKEDSKEGKDPLSHTKGSKGEGRKGQPGKGTILMQKFCSKERGGKIKCIKGKGPPGKDTKNIEKYFPKKRRGKSKSLKGKKPREKSIENTPKRCLKKKIKAIKSIKDTKNLVGMQKGGEKKGLNQRKLSLVKDCTHTQDRREG